MDDRGGNPDDLGGRGLFDVFALVTYRLFGSSFLIVAGGAVGGLVLFLITVAAAWALNAGVMAPVAGLVALPVGYILVARLLRGRLRRSAPRG